MSSHRIQVAFASALILLLFALPIATSAQSNSATCQAIITQAATSAGVNCANRSTGTVCYGSPVVESNLEVDPSAFDQPSERVLLSDVIHLRPQAVNLASQTWGIFTANMQADLPEESPNDVVLLGLGGIELENGVETSPDATPAVDGFLPMQSFYLRTGVGGTPCEAAPSLLTVQGPRDETVTVEANGVTIQIGSTIVIRTFDAGEPVGRQMEIIVLSGVATIIPETGDPVMIPAGYKVIVTLGADLLSLGIEGDADERAVESIGTPVMLTQEEIDELEILTEIPDNILNYPIDLPQIITPSGTTNITTRIIFSNPLDIATVLDYCTSGILSEAICNTYGF